MSPRRGSITGEELKAHLAELEKDPEYRRRMAELDRQRAVRRAAHADAAAPVVRELREAGLPIENLSDLRRLRRPYPEAFPILLRWLGKVAYPDAAEQLVGLLGVPWADHRVRAALLEEFRKEPPFPGLEGSRYRGRVAQSIENAADNSIANEIIALASDRGFGGARCELVFALRKLKDPRVNPLLIELLRDPNEHVIFWAVKALRHRRAVVAYDAVAALLSCDDKNLRKEAAAALKAWDKILARKAGTDTAP